MTRFLLVALAALLLTAPAAQAAELLAPPDTVLGERDGTVNLVVRLSGASASTVSVNYATANSTAFASTACTFDYFATSGTLIFDPGQTSKTIPVTLGDCPNVEPLESFTLNLSTPINATISRASTRVSIVDDDTQVATPSLLVRDAIVDESDGVARVVVLLGGPHGRRSATPVTVDYSTPGDGAPQSGTLTFTPGQTVKTVEVPITDDAQAELARSFTFTLANAGNATIADSTARVTIGANDAPAVGQPAILTAADAIVAEDDGYVDLAVRLSAPGTQPVTVDYETANSTTYASTSCTFDYVHSNGYLTFAPGETTKVVRVELADCAGENRTRSFTFNLEDPINSTITRPSQRITLIDNDTVATTPRLLVRDAIVDERDGEALVTVLLARASAGTVTVDYSTPGDGAPQTGTLLFLPGHTAATVAIPIVDDAQAEPAERFMFTLANAINATIGDSTGTVTIGASDAPPVAQPAISAAADAVAGESDGYVDLAVRLSAPGTQRVTVNYVTANDTTYASTGCSFDYVGVGGGLTFAPGETTKVVRVEVANCDGVNRTRSFRMNLTGPTNATIARATQRVTLIDNDTIAATPPPLFTRDVTVDESDGDALVPVWLGAASNSTITVAYSTPGDGAPQSRTLTFAPGETVKTVAVPIARDTLAEPAQRFTLTLSAAVNATIAEPTGTVTIGASDAPAVGQPAISAAADAIVGESDGFVDLAVRLSAPGTQPVTLAYATANDTTYASTSCTFDYVAASGALTFAPGETTKVVRVEIADCDREDLTRSFLFRLSAPTGATIARAAQRVTLIDNDTLSPTPALRARDAWVDEKDGLAFVSVLLDHASASYVKVDYATPGDGAPRSGTLTFAPGQTAKTVALPIADDALAEPDTSFALTLANPSNATLAGGAATVTIGASDAAAVGQPAVSAPADGFVSDLDGYIDLLVRLAAPGTQSVAVDYTTADVTAYASTGCTFDYVHASGRLTFAPGETIKVVRVEIAACPNTATLETFAFTLSAPTNATLARTAARVFILAGARMLTSLTIAPTAQTLDSGLSRTFTATGHFDDNSTLDLTRDVNWVSSVGAVATIDATGRARAVSGGTTTLSATIGVVTDSTVLTATETISFSTLSNRTFGDADFTLSATSNSGQPVGYVAVGECTVADARVYITGAGSCTVTASRPFATAVARAFTIAKASQTITFDWLSSRTVGDPDVTLAATASSRLPVAFSASGACSVQGAGVRLAGPGTCTVTATQEGDANHSAAFAQTRSFSIVARQSTPIRTVIPTPSPTRCTVPNVIGKTLAAARKAIAAAHCAAGKVRQRYSSKVKRGKVVSQSRKAGKSYASETRIDLVVSRGRRR